MRYAEIFEIESQQGRAAQLAKSRSQLSAANAKKSKAARDYQDKIKSANNAISNSQRNLADLNRPS